MPEKTNSRTRKKKTYWGNPNKAEAEVVVIVEIIFVSLAYPSLPVERKSKNVTIVITTTKMLHPRIGHHCSLVYRTWYWL